MKKIAVVLALSYVLVFAVSCTSIKETVSINPGVSVKSPKISFPGARFSVSDILEEDEFVVSDRETSSRGQIGKMLTPPSESKHEAEFLVYANSKKAWKGYFVKIKPATGEDFTVGNDVIYFYGNPRDGVYHLPKDRASARKGYWYKALITDNSLLKQRGIVYVADKRVDKDNTFVAVKE